MRQWHPSMRPALPAQPDGGSSALPSRNMSLGLRASNGLRAPDAHPWMVLACARPQGAGKLWLASFRRLDQAFLSTLAPASPGVELTVSGMARGSPKGAALYAESEALAIPDVTGASPMRFASRVASAERQPAEQ